MAWTEERVSVLKRMWTEGHSASQIAKSLGEVTRNAVIGKVHRLGLSGRATPSRPVKRTKTFAAPTNAVVAPAAEPAQAAARTYSRAPISRKIAELTAVPAIRSAPSDEEVEAIAILERAAKLQPLKRADGMVTSIVTVQDSMCKWPIGDPQDKDFALCGRASKEAGPYCRDHAALAFQAPRSHVKKYA